MRRPLSEYQRVVCRREEYELLGTTDALLVLSPGDARVRFQPPVLTVEWRQKWYGLHLLSEGDPTRISTGAIAPLLVHRISWEFLPELPGQASYVDHVPNPEAVRQLCAEQGYELDELAEELIEGRWLLEVKRG